MFKLKPRADGPEEKFGRPSLIIRAWERQSVNGDWLQIEEGKD